MRDTQFQRPRQRAQRIGIVGVAIELAHAHAAQTQGGCDEARGAQFAVFHGCHVSHWKDGLSTKPGQRVAAVAALTS
ncbi:hypothetical protein D9M69_700290 [compost metagenome]